MKHYVGRYDLQGRLQVWIEEAGKPKVPLNPRLDLWNHSPDGFAIGYSGSGPAQLALAILADHLGDDVLAVRLHQAFKRHTTATYDPNFGFVITAEQISGIVQTLLDPKDPADGGDR